MATQDNNKNKIRHSRFFNINREFLVFVVFLLIALGFWLIQTFKDSTEIKLEYKLEVTGLSEKEQKVVKAPETIELNLQGKGFQLLKLALTPDRTLNVDVSEMNYKKGKYLINQTVWKEVTARSLPNDIKANTKELPNISFPCIEPANSK